MPPSARSRSAIPMSRGTPKGPMAGRPSACHWMMRRRNHARATKPISPLAVRKSLFARRIGVQGVLDRPSQLEQSLFDQDRYVAYIGDRFPPVLKDTRLPCELVRKLLALRLIGRRLFLRLVLRFPQFLGFLADALGHCLLFVGKALDPVHYLIALAVERRIQRGEQRLRLLLPFRVGSNHIVGDQFPRVLHRRATGGEP